MGDTRILLCNSYRVILSIHPETDVQAASPTLFAAAVNYTTRSSPRSITVGDFDNNGAQYLAVSDASTN
jgi:hypothetical protein